jgi:hypothetical protein
MVLEQPPNIVIIWGDDIGVQVDNPALGHPSDNQVVQLWKRTYHRPFPSGQFSCQISPVNLSGSESGQPSLRIRVIL